MYKLLLVLVLSVSCASCQAPQEYGSVAYESEISESIEHVVEAFQNAEKSI